MRVYTMWYGLTAVVYCTGVGAIRAQGVPAVSPTPAGPSAREWLDLPHVDGPVLSPDGRMVAYRRQTADWVNDGYASRTWLAPVKGGPHRPLAGDTATWSPRWSPDGRRIAYLKSTPLGAQVFISSLADAGARQVTQVTQAAGGVNDFQWAPDGSRIAYAVSEAVPPDDHVPDPPHYRIVGNAVPFSASLWVVDAAEAAADRAPARRLTRAGDFSVDDFVWSPDGSRIAFTANLYRDPHPFWTYSLYVISVSSATITKLVSGGRGPNFFPVWSPDGRDIAFKTFLRGPADEYHTYSIGYVAVVSAAGGAPRLLTDQFDENVTPLWWSPHGIYFAARERASAHLFRVDPTTKAIRRVTEPRASVNGGYSFSADGRLVAFSSSDAHSYQEIFVAPTRGRFTRVRITRAGDQLATWPRPTRELLQWTSRDGTPIEGVLITPPNVVPGRRYPLIVIPHTGPLEGDQLSRTRDLPYPAELFTARGIMVLRPNYRGSIGYGGRFRAALRRGLGVPQSDDLVTAIDSLVARGLVDSTRVGAAGWSHGAYVVQMTTVREHRFRAASILEGMSDWRLFYTLGAGSTVKPEHPLSSVWEDPDHVRATSPLTYIRHARTPTLIQHGEADGIAPIAGAREFYRGLVDHGVPTVMVTFPGMGHVPNRLALTLAIVEQNLDWFSHWLCDTPLVTLPRPPRR